MHKCCALLLSLLAIPIAAEKHTVPSQILHARSVAILYLSASGPSGAVNSPNLSAEDRAAISAVETAFKKWNRFIVLVDARQADLIVAVRTAQQSVYGGVVMGRRKGQIYGAQAGPNVDLLEVYGVNPDPNEPDIAGPVLWSGAQRHGLEQPGLPLVELFKDEVEEAAKKKK